MADASKTPALRDAIIRHLRQAGSDSISGVARALSSLQDAPVHRLTIAGHLAAMAEEGTLREVERPPSKHYQLSDARRHLSLHERVGAAVATLDVPAPDRATVATAVLNHLLRRPVFREELRSAGFPNLPRSVEEVDLGDDDRRILRSLFRDDGPSPLPIPRGDPLLRVRDGAVSAAAVQDAVRHIALHAGDAWHLQAPTSPEAKGIQARLDLGGPA